MGSNLRETVLFHRSGKKEKAPFTKPLKDLTAIASPQQLLSNPKRQALVNQIKASSGLEDSRFEGMCLSLIHHLIHHCQSLPETSNSYYSLPVGLLDHALNRTDAALSLFRDYILQDNGADLSEEQRLWIYALFSAGLLQGIGKLQIDYHVDLFDGNGQFLKSWSPLLESMASVGGYYCFEFQTEGSVEFRRRLNLLLARLLMPESGFNWIVSNPSVLAIWLALLNEDPRDAGTLGAILIRADAIAIQRYFTEYLIIGQPGGHHTRPKRLATFVDTAPSAEKEQLMGIDFIKWINLQLASGNIIINQSTVLMLVSGGLLLMPELFKLFLREHPEYKNWQAVQKGFLSLKMHALGTDGSALSRVEAAHTHEILSGNLLVNYAVALPETMKIQNISTGVVSTISAVELIHGQGSAPTALMNLSARGQWLPPETKGPVPQSGNIRSG